MIDDISRKAGLPPGTIVHTGESHPEQTKLTVIDFNNEILDVVTEADISDCVPSIKKNQTRWIHVKGVFDVAAIRDIGEAFEIHPLIIEDF